jgi:hypothetical protein
MILQSKYDMGDTVFGPSYESIHTSEACPDCLGQRHWIATTPAGESVEIACPACEDGWQSTGQVKRFQVIPVVRQLTVGQVRYESDFDGERDAMAFRYMCVETGVGTGTVYREADLYREHDEALEAAKLKAEEVFASITANNDKQKADRIKQAARRGKCPHCEGSGRRQNRA